MESRGSTLQSPCTLLASSNLINPLHAAERAVGNGCLYSAFRMRQFCPTSCNVPRCSVQGKRVGRICGLHEGPAMCNVSGGYPHQIASHALQIVRKGHATPEGTAFYRMGMDDLYTIGRGHWRVTAAVSDTGVLGHRPLSIIQPSDCPPSMGYTWPQLLRLGCTSGSVNNFAIGALTFMPQMPRGAASVQISLLE